MGQFDLIGADVISGIKRDADKLLKFLNRYGSYITSINGDMTIVDTYSSGLDYLKITIVDDDPAGYVIDWWEDDFEPDSSDEQRYWDLLEEWVADLDLELRRSGSKYEGDYIAVMRTDVSTFLNFMDAGGDVLFFYH